MLQLPAPTIYRRKADGERLPQSQQSAKPATRPTQQNNTAAEGAVDSFVFPSHFVTMCILILAATTFYWTRPPQQPSIIEMALSKQLEPVKVLLNAANNTIAQCDLASTELLPVLHSPDRSWAHQIDVVFLTDSGLERRLLHRAKRAFRSNDYFRSVEAVEALLCSNQPRSVSLQNAETQLQLFQNKLLEVNTAIERNVTNADSAWASAWLCNLSKSEIEQAKEWRKVRKLCTPVLERAQALIKEARDIHALLRSRIVAFHDDTRYLINSLVQDGQLRQAEDAFLNIIWAYIHEDSITYGQWIEHWEQL